MISTQIPMLGIFPQTSRILEKVNNLIGYEELLPKITKFCNDIKEIMGVAKPNEKLENIYEKAKKVAAISEISKEPP